MRKDANEITYEEISLLGLPALLTEWRVDRTTLPEGLFLYELRHTDEDWGEPCQLAKSILVNFYATVLTAQPIPLPAYGYLDFESRVFVYKEEDACVTVQDFLDKYGERVGSHAQRHI